MAHELHFTDGQADMFSVRELPWHRYGHVVDTAPTLDEAIQMANLGYTVEKVPVYINVNGTPMELADQYAIVRNDTGTVLSKKTVGRVYTPVQNADGFRILEPLLDSGIATLETGGVLRGGADAWLMVKWALDKMDESVQEVFGKETLAYGFLSQNHDGTKPMTLQDTNIRIVCANTLCFAHNEKTERRITVRHSTQGMDRLVEAAERMWGGIKSRYSTLSEQYRILKQNFLTEAEFNALVLDVAAPLPQNDPNFKSKEQGNRQADATIERAERKRDTIRHLWTKGSGHTGDFSAWEAYNGLVEAVDHDTELWRVNKGGERLNRLAFGDLGDLKHDVLSSLLVGVASR